MRVVGGESDGRLTRTSDLQPESLRARAEQCRRRAETFHDESVKAKMLKVADGYHQMADRAERIDKAAWFLAARVAPLTYIKLAP